MVDGRKYLIHQITPSEGASFNPTLGPAENEAMQELSLVSDAANLVKGLKKQRASKLKKY